MESPENPGIPMLHHTLATLAYRAAKTLRGAPANFENFRAATTSRSAAEILAHMIDLLDWSRRAADGQTGWRASHPESWDNQIAKFSAALKAFDDRLATRTPLASSPEKFFQEPIADAFTHVGQLATLRRLAGSGARGEDYFSAEIAAGRVGMDQAPPIREFD